MADFVVGARVRVEDERSEFHGREGELKSQVPARSAGPGAVLAPAPPAGRTGRSWNVLLDGDEDEAKFDEAQLHAL